MRHALLVLLLALAATAVVTPCLAAGEDAQTLFAQGRLARDEGDCKRALSFFQKALELAPEGIGSLRNVAECQEELQRYSDARRSYWDLRRRALMSSQPKYDDWSEWAEKQHKRLAGRVADLTIEIRGDDGFEVTLDGAPLDPRLLGTALERDAGEHEVRVDYGGAEPISRSVNLVAGQAQTVRIELPKKKAPTLPAAAPIATPGEEGGDAGSDGAEQRVGAVVAWTVGGIALAGGVVAVAIRAGAISDLESTCPQYENASCPPDVQDAVDRGETASTMSNVLFGVAAAGVVAGTVLWFTAPSASDGSVGLSVAPNGLKLQGTF